MRGPGLAPWPDGWLIGRDDLMDELVASARNAASGAGSVVVLSGEAGMGKTSVARALVHNVRDAFANSWTSCSADGSAPPFSPWRDLIEDDHPPAKSPVEDEAAGALRFERLRTRREQILVAARTHPRLHVIEDLQWADVASVLLLEQIAERAGDVPLLVLATVRTGEALSPQLDGAIEQVHRLARLRVLAPLTESDIATMGRLGGLPEDPEMVHLLHHRTGGVPLLVSELLRSAPRSDDPAYRLDALRDAVPTRVADLVAHRVSRLPGRVGDALAAAAVMGAEGEVRTLASICSTDVEALVGLLDQGRAADLLDAAPAGRWRFRHALIRDAVYSGVDDVARARLHADVLEALAVDNQAPPSVLAHHALAAQPRLDADRAVALAARAGEWAFAHDAYEEAITWFERALAASPPESSPRWRAELLVLGGEAHRHLGDIGEARRAFLGASELTDEPALLARAALGYADPGADLGIAYRSDDPKTADLLSRAIAAQPEADSPMVVALEARLAAELYFSDEPGRAAALATSAVGRARRLGDERSLGAATAVAHDSFSVGQIDIRDQLAESEQLLAWARTSGSIAGLLAAHRARVFDLLAAGDIAGMDVEITAFQRLAEPLRAPGYLWWPALWSAMRALLEGRHDLAEARALAAYEIGQAPFPTLAMFNLSFQLFFLRREQGRLGELEEMTRDVAASRADIPAIRVALAFLLAECGKLEEAAGMLRAFDESALHRLRDRNWPASWFQLSRAAFLVGDQTLATRLLADGRPSEPCVMVSLATVCLGASALAMAWLHHTVGNIDAADASYAAAAEMNARIGAKSWLAQTRTDHAQLRGPQLHAAPTEASFVRVGTVWEFGYGDRIARLPDSRGLVDLALLLARPHEALSVVELAGAAAASTAAGAEALDDRARREIRDRLRALDAEVADAEAAGDGEGEALAREQLQELAEAVAGDFGLGGRVRRIGDPVERARKTVSTRLRRAIAAVGRVHPELGRHLERSIDTGRWCAYRPAEQVHWKT